MPRSDDAPFCTSGPLIWQTFSMVICLVGMIIVGILTTLANCHRGGSSSSTPGFYGETSSRHEHCDKVPVPQLAIPYFAASAFGIVWPAILCLSCVHEHRSARLGLYSSANLALIMLYVASAALCGVFRFNEWAVVLGFSLGQCMFPLLLLQRAARRLLHRRSTGTDSPTQPATSQTSRPSPSPDAASRGLARATAANAATQSRDDARDHPGRSGLGTPPRPASVSSYRRMSPAPPRAQLHSLRAAGSPEAAPRRSGSVETLPAYEEVETGKGVGEWVGRR